MFSGLVGSNRRVEREFSSSHSLAARARSLSLRAVCIEGQRGREKKRQRERIRVVETERKSGSRDSCLCVRKDSYVRVDARACSYIWAYQ